MWHAFQFLFLSHQLQITKMGSQDQGQQPYVLQHCQNFSVVHYFYISLIYFYVAGETNCITNDIRHVFLLKKHAYVFFIHIIIIMIHLVCHPLKKFHIFNKYIVLCVSFCCYIFYPNKKVLLLKFNPRSKHTFVRTWLERMS